MEAHNHIRNYWNYSLQGCSSGSSSCTCSCLCKHVHVYVCVCVLHMEWSHPLLTCFLNLLMFVPPVDFFTHQLARSCLIQHGPWPATCLIMICTPYRSPRLGRCCCQRSNIHNSQRLLCLQQNLQILQIRLYSRTRSSPADTPHYLAKKKLTAKLMMEHLLETSRSPQRCLNPSAPSPACRARLRCARSRRRVGKSS